MCSLLLTTIKLVTSGRKAEWAAEHSFINNSSARFLKIASQV